MPRGSYDYGPTFTPVFSIMSSPDAMLYEIPHQWIRRSINPWIVMLAKPLLARKANQVASWLPQRVTSQPGCFCFWQVGHSVAAVANLALVRGNPCSWTYV